MLIFSMKQMQTQHNKILHIFRICADMLMMHFEISYVIITEMHLFYIPISIVSENTEWMPNCMCVLSKGKSNQITTKIFHAVLILT